MGNISAKPTQNGRIQIGPKKKISLVLSGGGTKAGAFHLGVVLALREQGFHFLGGIKTDPNAVRPPVRPREISTYVGSSAGSIISTYLANGYSPDNIVNSFLSKKPQNLEETMPKVLPKLTYGTMFKMRSEIAKEQLSALLLIRKIVGELMNGKIEALVQFKWLKTTGIFSTSGLEQFLREQVLVSNQFQDYWADLFIVATQLDHSRKVVFGKYHNQPSPQDLNCQYDNQVSVAEACACSTALSFIYAPYSITNPSHTPPVTQYIDGEIRDTLSTHVAVDSGSDLVIASYTHQPYHYTPEIGSLTQLGLPSMIVQALYLVIEQKIRTHIREKKLKSNVMNAVLHYCEQNDISETHRKRIFEIMETELHHRLNVDAIYIHPSADDPKIFTSEHFTLSPKKLHEIMKAGFKAGVAELKKYDFSET